ncbi:MAG TPA: hypothetical protein VFT45_18775 [Longimicrobium sp.]|nr:hypothetical protein [Longimicrobium sp.]
MTDISPTAQPAPEALAGLLVGDTALAAPRSHGMPGELFIGSIYLMAVMSALRALVLVIALGNGPGVPAGVWKQGLAACVWAVLQWRLAGEVRRFSRWGWYGAMAELGAAAVMQVVVAVIVPTVAPWLLVLLVIEAGLLRYFWKRRAHFDVDLGG